MKKLFCVFSTLILVICLSAGLAFAGDANAEIGGIATDNSGAIANTGNNQNGTINTGTINSGASVGDGAIVGQGGTGIGVGGTGIGIGTGGEGGDATAININGNIFRPVNSNELNNYNSNELVNINGQWFAPSVSNYQTQGQMQGQNQNQGQSQSLNNNVNASAESESEANSESRSESTLIYAPTTNVEAPKVPNETPQIPAIYVNTPAVTPRMAREWDITEEWNFGIKPYDPKTMQIYGIAVYADGNLLDRINESELPFEALKWCTWAADQYGAENLAWRVKGFPKGYGIGGQSGGANATTTFGSNVNTSNLLGLLGIGINGVIDVREFGIYIINKKVAQEAGVVPTVAKSEEPKPVTVFNVKKPARKPFPNFATKGSQKMEPLAETKAPNDEGLRVIGISADGKSRFVEYN